MLDVSDVFDIREIKITDTSSEPRTNNKDDIKVTINWIALYDRNGNFSDRETYLYITLYVLTGETTMLLERKYVSFGTLTGMFFEIEKNMTIPLSLIKEMNLREYQVELSFTDKSENEIGLRQSLKKGTFFKTTLPLLFHPEEID